MAIFSLHVKIISRKMGRSSTAAAAYRAGERIVDQRTGEVHDYRHKKGVLFTEIMMPCSSDWKPDRAELWNAVEQKNKRQDAQVAREFMVALPHELPEEERKKLVIKFAAIIANLYHIAVDVAIHQPSTKGDDRNYHAHLLTSTNTVVDNGLGNKCRELDLIAHNMAGGIGQNNAIDYLRQRWATITNETLQQNGIEQQIDHRTLDEQGIDRAPTTHLGVIATAIERKTPEQSLRSIAQAELMQQCQPIEHEIANTEQRITELTTELDRLKALPPPNNQQIINEWERAEEQLAQQIQHKKQQRYNDEITAVDAIIEAILKERPKEGFFTFLFRSAFEQREAEWQADLNAESKARQQLNNPNTPDEWEKSKQEAHLLMQARDDYEVYQEAKQAEQAKQKERDELLWEQGRQARIKQREEEYLARKQEQKRPAEQDTKKRHQERFKEKGNALDRDDDELSL